jgi:PAS domain S-box-containing protein
MNGSGNLLHKPGEGLSEPLVYQSDETMRLIMNAALDAIICIDTGGKIMIWNPKAEEIFGWKEKEVTGKMLAETIIPVQYREQHEKGFKRYLETGTGNMLNKLVEITALNREGTEFPVELTIVPIKQNSTEFFCAFLRDITERKKTEKGLRESELRYRSLIDQASDAIMITDDTGNFRDVNISLCKMFGYSREELLKMNISSLIDPEQIRTDPIRFDMIMKGHSVLRERRMMDRNGKITEVEANVKMLPDGRVLAIARDITERKKIEDALRLSEQKYKLLFNKNPLPMWMFSKPDLHIIDVNESAIAQYGYSKDEFLSMSPMDFRPREDADRFLKESRKNIEGIYNLGTWRHRKKDGTVITVEIIADDIIYEGKPVRLVLAHDITEKTLAEENLKLSHEKLRQLSSHLENIREEERTNIAREIHDELGQQLTGLKMDVSWLGKKIPGENKTIHEKINGMISLIDDTVKTVRRISSELRPGILDDLGLIDALDWQSNEFEKRTGIRCKFHSAFSEKQFKKNLSTGVFRIYQEALTNVARHAEATEIDASLEQYNGNLILKVHDNGKGFDEAAIANKNTLGLTGMKERASMFGGMIIIESRMGRGTTVFLQVPLKESDAKLI